MLVKLLDIATVTMGQSPKSSAYNSTQDGLPFLQGRTTFGDKYPYFDTWTTEWNKEANKGDVLFTVRAPVGDINIATTRIAIGRGIAAITPKNVNAIYLYYLLQANRHNFLTSSAGTIFDSINKDALESIVLDVHNKEEQHHIVNTIGSIDDLIEKYQSILTKVDEIINLLFLNLEPSELRLADIADIKYGKGLEASKLTQNKQYPVYGSNGIIGTLDTYDFETPKIAISCRGASSGNVFLTKPYSSISSNSLYLNFKNNDNMLPIYSYLRRIGLSSFATGSAQPQITIENLQHLNVPNLKNCPTNHDKLIELWFEIQYKIDLVKKVKEILLNKYF